MNYEQALEQLVNEGAIRLWRVSGGWQIAYRVTDSRIEARGLHKIRNSWKLAETLVSSKTYRQPDGWYQVSDIHPRAKPIARESAQNNPGYFTGMVRQCQTCKKHRPILMYNREAIGERGFRTWECNICAQERREDINEYHILGNKRIGDYLQSGRHTSRPPVEGEI
jgi:hypothetical protein